MTRNKARTPYIYSHTKFLLRNTSLSITLAFHLFSTISGTEFAPPINMKKEQVLGCDKFIHSDFGMWILYPNEQIKLYQIPVLKG